MTALRRPIQVIAVTFAAVLFFVLAWAVFGFSGPATAIRQAGDLARNQRYTEAIKLLNRAENELGPPETAGPDLESLLDVRQFAYTALDNAQLAIADLQRLIILRSQRDAEVGTTRALRRKLVRQRLLAGQIAIARNEARRLYTEDTTDGRAAELVGEALQASYQGLLADVVTRIERAVTPLARADVVEPLRRWLYRDADDPGLEHARERFQQALAQHSAHDILVENLDRDLEELRAEVLRARQMYRTALASETAQPVAAYRGEAFALEESGKVLERELLAAAYLMRFDHVHSVMAATDQVKLLVDTGRPRAAIEAFRRFLPIDSWGARVQDGRLDQRVGKLFRAVAPAYAAVGDDAERAQLAAEVQSIEASGLLDLGDDFHWVLVETNTGPQGEKRTPLCDLLPHPRQLPDVRAEEAGIPRSRPSKCWRSSSHVAAKLGLSTSGVAAIPTTPITCARNFEKRNGKATPRGFVEPGTDWRQRDPTQ